MKNKIALMVAFGCLGASAASVNYDILGRKGSKMNSPMVYKNVDYAKTQKQKQEKVGSSLETRALQRTGMPDNVAAIEGSFRSYKSNNRFSIKRHYYGNPDNCNNSQCTYDWNGYKSRANSVFIRVNEDFDVNPDYETFDGLTHSEDNGIYTFSWELSFQDGWTSYPTLPSPFSGGQNITYVTSAVLYPGWMRGNYRNTINKTPSYAGVYMSASALPVTMTGHPVQYVRTDENETFNPTPGYEVRDSWTYYFLNYWSGVAYVGKTLEYGDPASKIPQVYVGIRNDRMGKGSSSSYSSLAKSLDNFIYRYRTIEFVPAGNYGVDGTTTQGNVCSIGQAANAVTVGAIDPYSDKIADYSSTKNYNMGSRKPEIYNYTHAVVGAPGRTGYTGKGIRRVYTQKNTGKDYVYESVIYGTETAAALLAGLVNVTMSYNPFYRWHPEVVKAFLLASDGRAINPPYPPNSAMKTGPSFPYFYFDDEGSNTHFDYDSRYWNGSIDNLKNRPIVGNGHKEIWFVTKNLGTSTKPASAAISWLSSGNDIANIGHIPQDFDLYVYGSNNSNYERYLDPHAKLDGLDFDNPGENIDYSSSGYNSYEKVTIASNYKYLIFRISMFSEDDRSENKGQVVMGFSMASADKQNYN